MTMAILLFLLLWFQPNDANSTTPKANGENGDNDSLWKGVRNFATMLMEDGEEEPGPTREPITVEGIDYHLGKIHVALSYDFQTLTLTLKILQAQQLPAKDFTGTSDPYVKILLLPDKKHKLLTKVKKKNLNPRWNECFLFEGKLSYSISLLSVKHTLLFYICKILMLTYTIDRKSTHICNIFPFECSVLNKGTTGTIFITSLV